MNMTYYISKVCARALVFTYCEDQKSLVIRGSTVFHIHHEGWKQGMLWFHALFASRECHLLHASVWLRPPLRLPLHLPRSYAQLVHHIYHSRPGSLFHSNLLGLG
jgi:hypothetical protein